METTGCTFTVGYFTSPGIDTRYKGQPAFNVSSERHWQSGVKEIAKVSKRPQCDSNPLPLDRQPQDITTEPLNNFILQLFRINYVF